jgi:hypothetical protein
MATEKEKCFRKALDKLNEGREAKGQSKLDVKHEQGWIRDANGSWKPQSWTNDLWYSIKKTLRIQQGTQSPRPGGAPNPIQYRKPDLTLTRPDGSKVVLDTKFTDADGRPDPWRAQDGMSGTKQKADYEDINQKQGNDVGEPKLDKNNCDCGKRKLETERVQVSVPSTQPGSQLFFAPLPATGGIVVPAPVPAPVPIPGGLIPVFP